MSTYQIYHETQEAGLCGVHCLNSLLQGPLYSEVDLANIARQLDATERQLMLESGADSKDYLKYLAEDSGNVADDGNYSVQVLAEALKVFGVEVLPLGRQEPPSDAQAFLCNLESHWFALRRLHGHWWDLNSLYPAPRWVSDLYLGVYLETLRSQGYTIFVLRGALPAPGSPATAGGLSLGLRGRWVPVRAGGSAAAADCDLERAIQASLGGRAPPSPSPSPADDPELAAAIAASLADGATAAPPAPRPAADADAEEARALAAALAMSLAAPTPLPLASPPTAPAPAAAPAHRAAQLPPPPPEPAVGEADAVRVAVRLPDGTRLERRWLGRTHTVRDVLAFVGAAMGPGALAAAKHRLVWTGPPRRELLLAPEAAELGLSVRDAGLANAMVSLERLPA